MRNILIAMALIAGFAGAVFADHILWIPASAHVAGVGGAQWRTDLEIHNPFSNDVTVYVELYESGKANPTPNINEVTITSNASVRSSDVLASLFSFTGSGALRISGDSAGLKVTSRTFNDSPSGTFGQFIPAISQANAVPAGDEAWLIQLSRSANGSTGFRTNIGFVNVGTESIDVMAELHDASGAVIGSVPVTLQGGEHRQITDIFGKVTTGDVADGFAIVTSSTTGGSFLTYASVVDNRTGDPIYVPAL